MLGGGVARATGARDGGRGAAIAGALEVLIPAHDKEKEIQATIASIRPEMLRLGERSPRAAFVVDVSELVRSQVCRWPSQCRL